MKYLTEEERVRRNLEFSRQFSVRFDTPLDAGGVDRGQDELRKLLVVFALQPGIGLTQGYRLAELHAEAGKRVKEKLIADGMVRTHGLVSKGSGGHFETLELLAPAIEMLGKMGIKPVELVGRGSWLHRVYVCCYLVKWAKWKGYRYWVERWLAPKCVDFCYEDEYGRLNAIEVALSGEASYILEESGMKCAKLEGIYRATLAFNDKELMKRVKKILKDELMGFQEKIRVEYLNEYWVDDEKK
jgi:hypothetical protein